MILGNWLLGFAKADFPHSLVDNAVIERCGFGFGLVVWVIARN